MTEQRVMMAERKAIEVVARTIAITQDETELEFSMAKQTMEIEPMATFPKIGRTVQRQS